MYRASISIVLLAVFVGCSEEQTNIESFLGNRLSPQESRRWGVSQNHSNGQHAMQMVASAQWLPSETVVVDDLRYTLAFDGDEHIAFIATSDPKFVTPEGIKVGTRFEDLPAIKKSEVAREPGWAYYVPLPCGWNAAFVQGKSMTEGDLSPRTRVSYFFMRSPAAVQKQTASGNL